VDLTKLRDADLDAVVNLIFKKKIYNYNREETIMKNKKKLFWLILPFTLIMFALLFLRYPIT
jgi:hypothetical protein